MRKELTVDVRSTTLHYFGTVQNRVRLQELGVDLLVLIADYQAITDRLAPTGQAGWPRRR
jgi:tryptophanyl-tRNA synthetase